MRTADRRRWPTLWAERQGLGKEMADALFATEEHSPEAIAALAEELGLDSAAFSACLNDADLSETLAWVEAADNGGLPQVWINDLVLIGQQTPASLEGALRRVADR